MKSFLLIRLTGAVIVTPLVGVWIEIFAFGFEKALDAVTPLVGVWIEIRPTGLINTKKGVTPLVGVWIEIK